MQMSESKTVDKILTKKVMNMVSTQLPQRPCWMVVGYLDAESWRYMDRILPGLWLGSQSALSEVIKTPNLLTHVVSVREANRLPKLPKQFQHLRIEAADIPTELLSNAFDQATEWIHKARQSGHGVLVHCRAGVSRSASIVIAYLIRYHEFTTEQAHSFVVWSRTIWPNPGFMHQLLTYEQQIAHKKEQ